jgi:hypothetical protein
MARLASSILLALVVAAVGPARAQCVDADLDAVCDAADNCPADPNPDQADADGDLAGDVCDAVDGAVDDPRVTLRLAANSFRGQGRGYLRVEPATAVFEVPSGVSIALRDGGTTLLQVAWAASECSTIRGASRCTSADRAARLVVKPVRNAPGLFRARVRTRQFAVATSFPGPGTFALTRDAVTWEGTATECSVKANGLSCRTPKF